MADLAEPDYGVAFYRSKDPIKNLRIRVKFKKVTSSFTSDDPREKIKNPDEEVYVFGWQEKVFSLGERQRYIDKENCITALENKYHEDLLRIQQQRRGFPTKRIFTYTDGDDFVKSYQKFTTSDKETPTYLSTKMSELRRRAPAGGKKDGSAKAPLPKMSLVIEEPTEDQTKTRHFLPPPRQTMFIMADLTPSLAPRAAGAEGADEAEEVPALPPGERDEVVLCTIQLDQAGLISIKPDFNGNTKPYRVESSVGRESYQFTLEHASKPIQPHEEEREGQMIAEMYTRHNELLRAMIGSEFDVPPQDVLKLVVLGEIVSAKDFEYTNMYIHFFVDLPHNWSAAPNQQLSGTTQLCQCSVKDRSDVAYFGFPFEFELFYTKDIVSEQKAETLPRWPTLYFEVLTLDSWTRYRTEGYGYVTLPSTTGRSIVSVDCWRPVGTESWGSIINELRRHFVGGTPELEDPTFSAIPTTFDGKFLGKYGFRTESTGTVQFRLHCMQQSRAFLDVRLSKQNARSLIERFGGSSQHSSVMAVINAFRKARQRMMMVREAFQPLGESRMNGAVKTGSGDRGRDSPDYDQED